MAECIYDIDEPDDLPENPELVEFLCAEPDKPPPEVQDPLEVIDLGTKEDPRPIQISAFRCPGHVGAYEYLVMPFGLKNVGATYQRAMNAIFHDLIGQSMEVYIDDIMVKSKTEEQHLVDLRRALIRMRIHKLKMNPKKCAFGVRAGNFLGFLVHQRGVEVDKNKSRAILESPPPTNKDKENFEWGPTHQQAFDSIKAYLTSPPVLVPPQRGKPLKLYISASEKSIGSLLSQNNEGGKEQAVYYLSRILTEVETRYSPVERLCLALYFTASKLRHYMLPCHVHIIARTDVIKYMLSKPMLAGRIGKWILALSEFSFQYVPQRAVKGQAIADFLTEHQEPQSEVINIPGSLEITSVWIPPRSDVSGKEDWVQQEIRKVTGLWITPWKLYFDGSHTQKAAGVGIVIINPQGVYHYYSFLLDYQENTNNRAEYEALIIGLEILLDLGATEVEIFGDSELVINQLNGEFKCKHVTMAGYYMAATQLLSFWESEISVNHIPKGSNLAANEMAQLASGVPIQERKYGVDVEIQTRNLSSIFDRGFSLDVMVLETKTEDWRSPIIHHLKDHSSPTSKKNRQQATKYVLWAKNLLRKTPDGLLLKCLGQEESMRIMAEVHEGICGAHQAGTKMRWLLRRYGYFWPDMEKDCKSYARGCEECQRHGPLQHVPSVPLNPVVKPWPFRGWAMDFIGQIYPASSKGHTFIIVATDYFTKWVEASAVKSITSAVVKNFIENKILHSAEYIKVMCQGVEDLDAARIEALNQIQEGKIDVARAYNKKVKVKSFKEGDLVWKTVLPLGTQLRNEQKHPINVKFLKKYCPTLWDFPLPTSVIALLPSSNWL
ncbi:unnamed protein product [Malus baccata var. baccata]